MKPFKTSLLSSAVIPAALLAVGVLSVPAVANDSAKPVAQIAANPCAAKNPCNPCGAKNPCNPCAAKNPCNPCGANPCGPCGAAAAPVELSAAEANAVYNCLKGEMKTAYAKSGNKYAKIFLNWKYYAKQPYVSATHGQRYVLNYANEKASNYGKYKKAGKMAPGAVSAKNSFTVNAKGQVSVGPLFLMEKHNAGFNANSHNWQYTLIMPNGQTVGTTNGKGKASVKFCYECHNAVAEDQDAMMFLPEELRVN